VTTPKQELSVADRIALDKHNAQVARLNALNRLLFWLTVVFYWLAAVMLWQAPDPLPRNVTDTVGWLFCIGTALAVGYCLTKTKTKTD
jgi:hypothetical protein